MNKNYTIITIAGLCLLAGSIYAGVSQYRADMAREAVTAPNDPKKKKAGEECKSSSECQHHHSCEKAGDKRVCTAPVMPHYKEIPNT